MSKFSDEIAEAVANRLLNFVPNSENNALTWRVSKKVASAYDGATANAHGDHDGTADPYTLFKVDGDVVISDLWGVVNTAVVSASNTGTLEVGVTGNTAKLIAQTTAGDGTLVAGDVVTDAGAEAGIDVTRTLARSTTSRAVRISSKPLPRTTSRQGKSIGTASGRL